MATSKHADLLNALDQMQASIAYAVRKPVLIQAERVIVNQEEKINELEKDLAAVVAMCHRLHDFTDCGCGFEYGCTDCDKVRRLKQEAGSLLDKFPPEAK